MIPDLLDYPELLRTALKKSLAAGGIDTFDVKSLTDTIKQLRLLKPSTAPPMSTIGAWM